MHIRTKPWGGVLLSLCLLFSRCRAVAVVSVSGQTFTPGYLIIDSPTPGSAATGASLLITLDVTANGKLPLPPWPTGSISQIYDISIFISSNVTGWNFTVATASSTTPKAPGNFLTGEPGSSVKHLTWYYPDCVVSTKANHGSYTFSIRQRFILNGIVYYTVSDVPITIGDGITASSQSPACASVNNPLLTAEQIAASDAALGVLFLPGSKLTVSTGVASFKPTVTTTATTSTTTSTTFTTTSETSTTTSATSTTTSTTSTTTSSTSTTTSSTATTTSSTATTTSSTTTTTSVTPTTTSVTTTTSETSTTTFETPTTTTGGPSSGYVTPSSTHSISLVQSLTKSLSSPTSSFGAPAASDSTPPAGGIGAGQIVWTAGMGGQKPRALPTDGLGETTTLDRGAVLRWAFIAFALLLLW